MGVGLPNRFLWNDDCPMRLDDYQSMFGHPSHPSTDLKLSRSNYWKHLPCHQKPNDILLLLGYYNGISYA